MKLNREPAAARVSVVTALGHALVLRCVIDGRWTVSVDDVVLPGSHGTEVEAWEAGLRAVQVQGQQGSGLQGHG